MEWLLELALIVLLAITLFHAIRLERALGVLKRDRAALQDLVNGFNASTQAAEQGIAQLRVATDGAGRVLTRQIETAKARQDDLAFLMERAERQADRLEGLVRSTRAVAGEPAAYDTMPAEPTWAEPAPRGTAPAFRPRSQAEQDLMKALNLAR